MEEKLILYFLDYKENNLFNYFSIGPEEKKIKINKNIVQIKINNPYVYPYQDHFIENIKLISQNDSKDKDDILCFDLDLYMGGINEYYCFINCKNQFSFEIIIFQKDFKLSIKSININGKKPYTLIKNNSFGLKNCKKFGIINCDKSYLNEFNFHFPPHVIQGSYYLNMFYPSINKPIFSLQKIKSINPKNININNLSDEQKKMLLNIKDNFWKLYNKYINKTKDRDKIKYDFHTELDSIYDKEYNFSNLKNLKYFLVRNKKLYLSDEDYDICFGYIIYKLIKAISNYLNAILLAGLIINLIDDLQLNMDKRNLNILRVLFWYKKYYISNPKFISKIIYFDDLEKAKSIQGFSFCYPKNCAKNTPYNNAISFMENFVEILNEHSYLLEIFYFIDSEASNNIIYKNCRMFKFSLLSLEQIKLHLKLLIPEIIIRYKNTDKIKNIFYPFNYGVVTIPEYEIFNLNEKDLDKCLINEEDINCKYSIPLIMYLFEKCFCQEINKSKSERNEFPNYFYNPYDNYNPTQYNYNRGNGKIFEFYISSNIDKIRFLKFSLSPLKELFDINLWVKENLDEINKIIDDKMKNFDMELIKDKKLYDFPNGYKKAKIYFAKNDSDCDSNGYISRYEEGKVFKKGKVYEKNCY